MKFGFIIILSFLSIPYTNSQNLDSWIGTYQFEEKPTKTQSGTLYMIMTWDLEILKGEERCYAILEINGEQTEMKIVTIVEGNENKVKFLFDKGLSGFGFEHLKKKEPLFELRQINGKIITHWINFEPRLREKYKNDTICFKKR